MLEESSPLGRPWPVLSISARSARNSRSSTPSSRNGSACCFPNHASGRNRAERLCPWRAARRSLDDRSRRLLDRERVAGAGRLSSLRSCSSPVRPPEASSGASKGYRAPASLLDQIDTGRSIAITPSERRPSAQCPRARRTGLPACLGATAVARRASRNADLAVGCGDLGGECPRRDCRSGRRRGDARRRPPEDSDHVVVFRALGHERGVVVFRGVRRSYRDVSARRCSAYRYTIVNYDPNGHRSTGVPTTVVTQGCT